jgi:glycosyltransferase involved in cell wall biosynthesis
VKDALVKIPCSVVVLTLNEQSNIRPCLESLGQMDDVHVVDSGSTDGTCEIARQCGAQVGINAFRSFADQRNWAHDHLALRHDWVLHLDADERLTDDLAQEIRLAISADTGSTAGWLIPERTLLNGQWLRHAAQYPRYQARFVHRRRMRFVDHGHGQRESSDLPFGRMQSAYEHWAFSHGLEHWLRKHATYAMQEARQILEGDQGHDGGLLAGVMGADPVARRRSLKRLALRMPMRPTLRWLHVMGSGAWLDGSAGLQYARMMRAFQQMIDLCISDLRRERRLAGVTAQAIASHKEVRS